MILDALSNSSIYLNQHPLFEQAFAFAQTSSFKNLPVGTHRIEGERLFVIIAEDQSREHHAKLEAHQKYIDIQMTLDGEFDIGWKSLAQCQTIDKPYDAENDFMLYADAPDFEMTLRPDSFAIFFPTDAHSPNAPKSFVKKAVFKVAV
jgi:YhcH/YjgK/YiaL family protein